MNKTVSGLNDMYIDDCYFSEFPKIISYIENPNQAEILMEALGTNLRKLLK